jgi:hypothetical protein
VPGIGQPDPACLGELATLAEPGHERADLAGQFGFVRGGFEIVHAAALRMQSSAVLARKSST